VIGCSTYRTKAISPAHTFLEKKMIPEAQSSAEKSAQQDPERQTDSLTMTQAIQLVLLQNTELMVYASEINVREARGRQDATIPNPGIELEVENFAGSGPLNGFNGSEFTLSIGQMIELAGKRYKRTKVAALYSDLAAYDREIKKLDVLTETRKKFIHLMADQQLVQLNRELVLLSEQLHQGVKKLFDAGRISAAEVSRTRIRLSTSRMELEKTEKQQETDRSRLSAMWGDYVPRFDFVKGSLAPPVIVQPLDSLKQYLDENPQFIRSTTEIELRRAMEELEQAKRIPDPTVSAGFRHLSEPGINAFLARVSMPIPLFNTNAGAVQEAYSLRKKAEEQSKSEKLNMVLDLIELYQELSTLYSIIENSNRTLIPEAENSFRIIREGYQTGKFGFLDVLESQKTLYEVRKELITSLLEYGIGIAEIERMIGRPLAVSEN
jgi:cobalt-zinc-cadmium efflux system outer membrane protein